MTYLEAIREDLRPFQASDTMIDRKCQRHGISSLNEAENETLVAIIEVELLSQMMVLGSVSEGGMSLSYDKSAVMARIKSICKLNGLDSSLYTDSPKLTFI